MKLPNKYIAIDIETTGSEGHIADVIQIGAVVLNEDLTVGNEFSIYIQPTTEYRDPKAMRVHGIPEETLAQAESAETALNAFEYFAKQIGYRPELAAWGIYFDIHFMKEYYRRIGRDWPFSHKAFCLKTASIWEASSKDMPAGGGLGSFVERLGLTFDGMAHDGLDDIKNSIKVLRHLSSL